MIDLDDDRLAQVLASMTDLLVVEAAPASAPIGRRRPIKAVALAVAAAAVTVVSVSPLRGAVADWLGIGSTRIEVDPTPESTITPLPVIDEGLPTLEPLAAARLLGMPLPDLGTTTLGEPERLAAMPEGGVLVAWPDGSTLWIHDNEMDPQMLYKKLVSADAQVQWVDDLGEEALALTGEHVLHTPRRTLRATTTVLWREGRWEYRLESDRDSDDLVELARAIEREISD